MSWIWGNDEGCYRAWRYVCRLNERRLSGTWMVNEALLKRAEAILWARIHRSFNTARVGAILERE
jgi:hypothetical protein